MDQVILIEFHLKNWMRCGAVSLTVGGPPSPQKS